MKKRNKIIGVDFDGTLSNTVKYPAPGEPIQEVLDYIKEEKANGAYVILITMREGIFLDVAVKWCKEQGLEFDAVNDNLPHMKDFFESNPHKIFCNEYLDDMNIGGIENVIKEIRKKKGLDE